MKTSNMALQKIKREIKFNNMIKFEHHLLVDLRRHYVRDAHLKPTSI